MKGKMTRSYKENQVSSLTLIKTHNTSDIRYDVCRFFWGGALRYIWTGKYTYFKSILHFSAKGAAEVLETRTTAG